MTNQFEVESYRHYTGTSSFAPLRFVGVATNKSDRPLFLVKAAVSLLDAQGNVLAAASDYAPFIVAPLNVALPFVVEFEGTVPDTWQGVNVQMQGGTQATFPPVYLELRAERTTLQPSGSHFSVAGQVTNTGFNVAEDVRVLIAAYDSTGKVLDVGSGETELPDIAPGETSPFDVLLPSTTERPASFDVVVQGELGPTPTP